jgi:hypothetical protein
MNKEFEFTGNVHQSPVNPYSGSWRDQEHSTLRICSILDLLQGSN